MSESNELAVIVQQTGLATDSAAALLEIFQPIFAAAEALSREADAIQVTDATQVTEIKKARAMRLKLREVRVATEHARKQLKEESLRKGKAIDGIANIIKFLVEPVEDRLLEQEQFAERKEAERKAALVSTRQELLRPFGIDTSFYQLGDMPEATFAQLLDSSRIAHEARLEAARKAEAERVAAEAARIEEERRVRAENERLKQEVAVREAEAKAERERAAAELKAAEDKARKEREAAEAKAAAERKAAEEKARKEREAVEAKVAAERMAAADAARKEREAAEAVARKEREAREALEAKVLAEKQAAERKAMDEANARKAAALAPDREKLAAFAMAVRAVPRPTMLSVEGRNAVNRATELIHSVAAEIEELASGMNPESSAKRAKRALVSA